jgi:hypothetical protein
MIRTSWRLGAAVLVIGTAACAHNPDPDPEPELVSEPVRIAPPAGALKPGDCPEALRRAEAKPDLFVDRLPSPHATAASALPLKSAPAAVRRAKYVDVRISVIIDTIGKPNMKSFTVLNTTHPWLADSFRSAVAKWSFDPAMVAGCKVPRVWLGTITWGKPPADTKKG